MKTLIKNTLRKTGKVIKWIAIAGTVAGVGTVLALTGSVKYKELRDGTTSLSVWDYNTAYRVSKSGTLVFRKDTDEGKIDYWFMDDGKGLVIAPVWSVEDCEDGARIETGLKFDSGENKLLGCDNKNGDATLWFVVKFTLGTPYKFEDGKQENLDGFSYNLTRWDVSRVAKQAQQYDTLHR